MLLNLIEESRPAAGHSEAAASSGHHVPWIAEQVNHLFGPAVYKLQEAIMPSLTGLWGGRWHGDPEMPIPVHIVMLLIAVFISTVVLYLIRGKLSVENPGTGQQALELIIGGVRGLVRDNIGPHGMKYFPMIGTFAVFIGVSNLMGLIPGLIAPTTNFNVPLGLAMLSFVYYNYIGIRENGLFGYLKHFAGPSLAMAALFFPVEIISNLARIISLSMRLLWNMFGDETLVGAFGQIFAWGLPVILMPLGLFVALMQAFIFTMLSILYIAEVSHHHESHEESNASPAGHAAHA
ncbi:MAG: F0F1 ATP synthase subunit A [Acidobacteria bacterium]|nr:F0F1 ATP synthase subunit A [Acidobacteriota bacterium]